MLDLLMSEGAQWFTGVAFVASLMFGITVLLLFVGMLWLGFKMVYSLAGDGNVDRCDAVGLVGTVTVAIPASGSGQVRLVIRNHQREFSATSLSIRIESHSAVRVVAVRDDGMLEVEPA